MYNLAHYYKLTKLKSDECSLPQSCGSKNRLG